MARGKRVIRRTRHNARSWIVKVLRESNGGRSMPTSEIQQRVAKMSGTRIPSYSIYQALRTLVKKKQVSSSRHGRELNFSLLAGNPRGASRASSEPSPPSTAAMALPEASSAGASLQLPHKLAPGEASIIHVGETHLETVTNVHGKIVLERHRRPAV